VPPNFIRSDFAAPRFVFEDAAQSTVQFMSAIYNGIDERIIEKTFDEIRKGVGNG
jgi:tRNA G37 N-methylase TrmD